MPKHTRDTAGGSIQFDYGGRKGIHRIRYWATDPKTGEYRRMSATVHGTRRDAKLERARLLLEHSEDRPCPTVGEVWERWVLPQYERRVEEGSMSPHTLAQYRTFWRAAAARWSDVPCDGVAPLDVQQWLDTQQYTRADGAMKVLRPTLDAAVRYGMIGSNPMRERYLMPSKGTVDEHDKGVWTFPELGELWRTIWGEWYEPTFLLAAFGGCRAGEAMGPLASEVQLRDVHGVKVTTVRIARQVKNKGEPTTRLKTPQSLRTVCIPGRAGLRLAELASDGRTWLTDDGNGSWIPQSRLSRAWSRLMSSGIAEHPFRNLRNSWETNCRWVLKLPPWIVEPMMGHRSDGVTGQYYDRPQAEMFAEAVAEAYGSSFYDSGWSWVDSMDN